MNPKAIDPRTSNAVASAMELFWREIAESFPEVSTGDFSPGDTLAFESACFRAVNVWLANNRPQDPIDVLTAMGFGSAGGGCTALIFERPDGQQCMVTNEAGRPSCGEGWDVGFYASQDGSQDGRPGECISVTSYKPDKLITALARIAEWRVG